MTPPANTSGPHNTAVFMARTPVKEAATTMPASERKMPAMAISELTTTNAARSLFRFTVSRTMLRGIGLTSGP